MRDILTRSLGFEQSEAAFRKEAKLVSDNLLEVGTSKENSVSDYILFYNESEASNPNAYERSYERLRRWVEDSIDKYKVRGHFLDALQTQPMLNGVRSNYDGSSFPYLSTLTWT